MTILLLAKLPTKDWYKEVPVAPLVYLFFNESCFRVRVRVRVDTYPNPNTKTPALAPSPHFT